MASVTEKKITYFQYPGKQNTDACLDAAIARAKELGIKKFVVATCSGYTPLRLKEKLGGEAGEYTIIAVGVSAHAPKMTIPEDKRKELENAGIKIVYAYSGIEEALQRLELPYASPERAAAGVLSLFSIGMHSILWITLAALDQGLIAPDEEVIAIAGAWAYGGGADTAVVIKPGVPFMTFDRVHGMKIKEIICMPREKTPPTEGGAPTPPGSGGTAPTQY